jgi:AcrR family transcriptional regulator
LRSDALAGSPTADRYHHGDLARALLTAAAAMLEDSGVEGFTLRECARRAGVSHGAPAHHFGDVRGLLSELCAESFEQLDLHMHAFRDAAPADAFAQLVALGEAYVDYALRNRARFQLMFRSDRLDWTQPRLQVAGEMAYRQLTDCVAAVAVPAISRGQVPEFAASLARKTALAWSIVHGLASLCIDNRLFGEAFGADPQRVLPTLRLMLTDCRPAFEQAG